MKEIHIQIGTVHISIKYNVGLDIFWNEGIPMTEAIMSENKIDMYIETHSFTFRNFIMITPKCKEILMKTNKH